MDFHAALFRFTMSIFPIRAPQAFSCFQFQDGRSWLIADVAIECSTREHVDAMVIAVVAILLYPVGRFGLNAALLFRARAAIRSEVPSPLSSALNFLHREYECDYFWW